MGTKWPNYVRNDQIENKIGYEMTKMVRNHLGTKWPGYRNDRLPVSRQYRQFPCDLCKHGHLRVWIKTYVRYIREFNSAIFDVLPEKSENRSPPPLPPHTHLFKAPQSSRSHKKTKWSIPLHSQRFNNLLRYQVREAFIFTSVGRY